MSSLTWFGWVLIGMYVFTSLRTVAMVGKYRKPIDPGEAVLTIILAGLIVLGILTVGVNA